MTEPQAFFPSPEEVVADALARAGGEGGMSSIGRFPWFYAQRAEAIVAELREAGWLRDEASHA